MEEFLKVIRKNNYVLQCTFPSYVKVFVDENEDDGYFVYLPREPKAISPNGEGDTLSSCLDSTDLDLTGSPLKVTFYDAQLNDTTIIQPTDWLMDEENHLGLSKQDASKLASHYFLKMPGGGNKPLWIVCSGKGQQPTLLLAAHKNENWLSRTEVKFCGLHSIFSPELDPKNMEHQHSLLSHGVSISKPRVLCTYVIFENDAIGGNPALDRSLVESNIKIKVDLEWHSAAIKPPNETVTAKLNVQMNVGHYSSAILALWQQLCLLCQLLEARASAGHEQPAFPSNWSVRDDVPAKEKIMQLLLSPKKYKAPLRGEEKKMGNEDWDQLRCIALEVVKESPENHDLTDSLWLIMKGCSDVTELLNCWEFIFSEVRNNSTKPFVRTSNQSTVAKNILKLMKDETTSITLTVNSALNFLIEIGIEKLAHDYTYMFLKTGLASLEVLKQGMSTDKSSCPLSSGLTWLTRLHSALEVLLVVQEHLSFSRSILYSLSLQVLNSCNNSIQSFDSLKSKPHISLALPVPFDYVKNRLPSQFIKWQMRIKTDTEKKKRTSVFYCSSSFIFPPSVYSFDDSVLDTSKENYFLFRLSSWKDKV